MTPVMDDEARSGSVNESDSRPEVQTIAASSRTTSTGGVERFASVSMENIYGEVTRTLSGSDK